MLTYAKTNDLAIKSQSYFGLMTWSMCCMLAFHILFVSVYLFFLNANYDAQQTRYKVFYQSALFQFRIRLIISTYKFGVSLRRFPSFTPISSLVSKISNSCHWDHISLDLRVFGYIQPVSSSVGGFRATFFQQLSLFAC